MSNRSEKKGSAKWRGVWTAVGDGDSAVFRSEGIARQRNACPECGCEVLCLRVEGGGNGLQKAIAGEDMCADRRWGMTS